MRICESEKEEEKSRFYALEMKLEMHKTKVTAVVLAFLF